MPVVPLPFALNDRNFLSRVQEVAADSSRIRISKHATTRMKQRRISIADIQRCLLGGYVAESAALDAHGNWQGRIAHRWAGVSIKVAVALVSMPATGEACVVITVMR